jgi:hypothetical protein
MRARQLCMRLPLLLTPRLRPPCPKIAAGRPDLGPELAGRAVWEGHDQAGIGCAQRIRHRKAHRQEQPCQEVGLYQMRCATNSDRSKSHDDIPFRFDAAIRSAELCSSLSRLSLDYESTACEHVHVFGAKVIYLQ